MSLSRNDQVEAKTIENGVRVPAGLQVGEMTLAEHQDYLRWMKMQKPLTREEAIAAGHRPKEVYKYFGPLDNTLEAKPVLELKAVSYSGLTSAPQALAIARKELAEEFAK